MAIKHLKEEISILEKDLKFFKRNLFGCVESVEEFVNEIENRVMDFLKSEFIRADKKCDNVTVKPFVVEKRDYSNAQMRFVNTNRQSYNGFKHSNRNNNLKVRNNFNTSFKSREVSYLNKSDSYSDLSVKSGNFKNSNFKKNNHRSRDSSSASRHENNNRNKRDNNYTRNKLSSYSSERDDLNNVNNESTNSTKNSRISFSNNNKTMSKNKKSINFRLPQNSNPKK
ncbi:unnamed protein product [Brachionus calyciflorus]|uniref:Uncharacterized protein n=1 Tax=Brachionus calyciflorus TaxID=104777 RepID=A0A814J081_9BILA|nr:unnamed protein product [Brachionus calyciflorus]